ncbi:unnamed protein product [Nippostrongylus brasiliensis]|uniref:BPTI/Kunitz inhibitor domain-containing protein n=1 Tax=Nippostrongylus brasiliensis TaxID=27835 RepID=A0A0N4YY11_NIPBR|nr:unnamed protein product [Nippostrongylus brasiliensis]
MLQFLILLLASDLGEAVDCHQPRDRGFSCDEPEKIYFYYDTRIGACQPMLLRGCGGNENKFSTAAECKEKCFRGAKNSTNSAAATNMKKENEGLVVTECDLPTDAKIPDVARSCDEGCLVGYRCNKKNKCCPMREAPLSTVRALLTK